MKSFYEFLVQFGGGQFGGKGGFGNGDNGL